MSETRLSGLFRQEVLDRFAQATSQAVFLSRPVSGYAMAIVATLACIGVVVFATGFQFARKEQALGVLVPASGWSRVSAPVTGVVRRAAKAGDNVQEGDVLLALSSGDGVRPTVTLPEDLLVQLAARIRSLEERLVLMDEQHRNRQAGLAEERAATSRALQRSDVELKLHRSRLALATERYENARRLVRSGVVARTQLLDATEELQARLLAVAAQERVRDELRSAIKTAGIEADRLALDHLMEQARLREEVHRLVAQQSQVQAEQSGLVLAPRQGVVASVRVRDGDWVLAGMPLADIVPSGGDLHARLFVAPAAMGFVDVGTHVRVFVDAFPYERYGAQHGAVKSISETTVHPPDALGMMPGSAMYQVDVSFPEGFSPTIRDEALRPGMTVSADLVRDYGSLASWLFEPIRATAERL